MIYTHESLQLPGPLSRTIREFNSNDNDEDSDDADYTPIIIQKGVYIDGHERQDVVGYRKLFLKKMELLETIHAQPPQASDKGRVITES